MSATKQDIENLQANMINMGNNLQANQVNNFNNLQNNQNGLQKEINTNKETLNTHFGLVSKNIEDIKGLASRVALIEQAVAAAIPLSVKANPPPWAGKAYTFMNFIVETSKFNRWNPPNMPSAVPCEILGSGGIRVKATYQFSADGSKLLRHSGTSTESFAKIETNTNPVVPFEIVEDGLVPLTSENTVYFGRRLIPYEGGQFVQTYYRNPGVKFNSDYTEMTLRNDPTAHFLSDFGLEFWYDASSTGPLVAAETIDQWVLDNAGYGLNDASELRFVRDIEFESGLSFEQYVQRDPVATAEMSIVSDPAPDQERLVYDKLGGWRDKPSRSCDASPMGD